VHEVVQVLRASANTSAYSKSLANTCAHSKSLANTCSKPGIPCAFSKSLLCQHSEQPVWRTRLFRQRVLPRGSLLQGAERMVVAVLLLRVLSRPSLPGEPAKQECTAQKGCQQET